MLLYISWDWCFTVVGFTFFFIFSMFSCSILFTYLGVEKYCRKGTFSCICQHRRYFFLHLPTWITAHRVAILFISNVNVLFFLSYYYITITSLCHKLLVYWYDKCSIWIISVILLLQFNGIATFTLTNIYINYE